MHASVLALHMAVSSMLAPAADGVAEVRLGIVAFEDFRGAVEQAKHVLADLSRADPSIRFKVAAGTYGDVLHWLERSLIDVAIVTPGLCAELLFPKLGAARVEPAARFLASVGKPPCSAPWASADRRQGGYSDHYRAVCLVSARSKLQSLDDMRSAIAGGRIRFLCVHPVSVSSRVAPAFVLRQLGIDFSAVPTEYTHSHTTALRILASSNGSSPEPVAFVWDDALRPAPELVEAMRRLPFPELEQLEIPSEAVLARNDFEWTERIRTLLQQHVDAAGNPDFLASPDGQSRYAAVGRWQAIVGVGENDLRNVSLEDIGRLLLHHARSQPTRPRLALVLSGGGAKCAYQVGVVAALEEHLEHLRRANPEIDLDIDLVVGTSGGAINALPIALGITRTAAGRTEFLDTWSNLDQRQIVRPARAVRANIGLWFALMQAALALWLIRRFVSRPERRPWVFAAIFCVLAAAEFVLRYANFAPWNLLGANHWLHHVWLWMSFGMGGAAWSALLLGAGAFCLQWLARRRGTSLAISSRHATLVLVAGLFALPLLQVTTLLFFQETFSGAAGIERALSAHFPQMIDSQSRRSGSQGLSLAAGHDTSLRLRSVSRQVFDKNLLTRDMVLTGSCLEQSSSSLPSDLYFYAAARTSSPRPPFGARGIDLGAHPGLLLDVVLGSGSIFPVFPPRRLIDFPAPGEYIDLIDGGFAHNSPIEAAVLWGATHVLLIEATPRERATRENFLQNAAASFDHLYEQSQVLDARSRGKVAVFTLSPTAPHLCVLDFASNLVRAAADSGYRDASGKGPADGVQSAAPRFQKEPGEPIFVDVAGQ